MVNGFVVLALITWILLAIVCFFVAGSIGAAKGRPGMGYALGLVFSFVGVIIIALLPPSPDWIARAEAERRRRDESLAEAVRASVQPPATESSVPSRRDLVAEAIRRDPSLGADQDPTTLRRLAEVVAALQQEFELRADLSALEAQARADEELRAKRAAAEAEQVKRVQRAQQAAAQEEEYQRKARLREAEDAATEAQRLAEMPPLRRWVTTHTSVLKVAGALLAVPLVAWGLWALTTSAQQEAQLAQAQEQAQEAALAESCGENYSGPWPDNATLARWVDCGNEAVQLTILRDYPGAGGFGGRFVKSRFPSVRMALAETTSSDEILKRLAQDDDVAVRLAVASRDVNGSVLQKMTTDEDASVRAAVALNPKSSITTLQELVRDPDPQTAVGALSSLVTMGEREAAVDGEWSYYVLRAFKSGCQWADRGRKTQDLKQSFKDELASVPDVAELCRRLK